MAMIPVFETLDLSSPTPLLLPLLLLLVLLLQFVLWLLRLLQLLTLPLPPLTSPLLPLQVCNGGCAVIWFGIAMPI